MTVAVAAFLTVLACLMLSNGRRRNADIPMRFPPTERRGGEIEHARNTMGMHGMDRQETNTPPHREPLPAGIASPAGTISALIASLRKFGDQLLTLVTLEGKRAGTSLAFMLGFAVAAAALVVTGWLALIACIVVALVANDIVGWPWALLLAALFSFAGAAGLVVLLIQRSNDLLFTATRRQLALQTEATSHE